MSKQGKILNNQFGFLRKKTNEVQAIVLHDALLNKEKITNYDKESQIIK